MLNGKLNLAPYPKELSDQGIDWVLIEAKAKEGAWGGDFLWFPSKAHRFYLGAGIYLYKHYGRVIPERGESEVYKVQESSWEIPLSVGYQHPIGDKVVLGVGYHELRGYNLLLGIKY